MWLLFHRKAGTKVVAGGKSFTDHCPTCDRSTRFAEVEVGESYGVWFIDVVEDKERAFRCERCGDVFDLRDAPAKPVPEADRRQAELDRVEALAAEQRRREAAKAARETQIDDELAELKKRMGR